LQERADWTGTGVLRIGVYRNDTWYLDLNNNLAWDGPATDAQFSFGASGLVPVVGDWNGDGKTKIGVFDPTTCAWYLDWNRNGRWDPGVDKMGFFGASGFVPVVGDWNGDGKDEVGMFNPANGAWYLDTNGNLSWDGTPTDKTGFFGVAGFTPVVGDWTGDGRTKVGVFNPANGAWYLDTNNNLSWDGSPTDQAGFFGTAGFTPIVGEWVGDGKTRVGVFNPANAAWYLDWNANLTWDGSPADKAGFFGVGGMTPIPGRW
jgi:hypothetical protein